jgi:hypothetical protein
VAHNSRNAATAEKFAEQKSVSQMRIDPAMLNCANKWHDVEGRDAH